MQIAGNIIIIFGIVLMFFGIIGIFRFKNFYARIITSSLIDTAGVISIIIGLALKQGFNFFSLKLLLLLVLIIIINPLIAHMTARSAFLSGYKEDSHTSTEEDNL